MQGQLHTEPLAELIREIVAVRLSGALRLQHERAKAAIYFEGGKVVFAASNLRPHRLRECLKRGGLSDTQLSEFPDATDDALAAALLQSGRLSNERLANIRAQQVSDVLRTSLLWT